MTLEEGKNKLKELGLIGVLKDKGFWDKDDKQLLYASDVIGKGGINKEKRNFFLIREQLVELPSPLKAMIINHFEHGADIIAVDIITGNERVKVPLKYFNKIEDKPTEYISKPFETDQLQQYIQTYNNIGDKFVEFIKSPDVNRIELIKLIIEYK